MHRGGRPPGRDEAHAHSDERAAHDRHAGHSVAMFRTRFWVPLVLTIPTVVLLPPTMGAVLMSLSTVIVAINAQLLRRTRL
jgi:cation transport ATPase